MASCSVREIPIEISSAGNGMRKIVLDAPATTRDLEVFYVDYRACRDSGWVRASYREDGRPAGEPQCLLGLRKSKLKLAMDVAAGADSSRILLDKGERDWALYELKARSNRARELHRAENREGGLLDVARLAMHDDDFGSLCWLADLEPSYSLDCTIFRAEPPYARQLGLRFHYRLRDFELALVDFKRIYALTSSSDDAGCAYDLWIFDVGGRALDGPLRIQGPRCARGRRLEPRPALARRGRDEPCASFAFELAGAGRAGARRFAALTECLLHSDRGGRLLLT
ncbi:uncharacterized protein LOC131670384 isoform X2 [Phymastichus coffea]|nr:uncharacterized protein LOC131670384 isoform X2 [Phymastichus coffea]